MADSRPLLDRLLHTPDLAKIVPHLQPEVLHRVIESCGLEDCAEVVALATPEQISRVLDLDIWRVRRPGADEEFDVHRFGVWLEVLMEAGPAIAAEKLSGLELSLVVVGLARHVAVFDHAAVSPFSTLDGEVVGGRTWNRGPVLEIGGYDVAARETSAWETIGELLTFLAAERPEYFHRLMRGCRRLSNGPREADGLHDLLEDDAQSMFDLGRDRETRRDAQGFVGPAQAQAFLQGAREFRLDTGQPSSDALSRAYFRAIASAEPGDDAAAQGFDDARSESPAVDEGGIDSSAVGAVMELLRDAGVIAQPRALLAAPADASAARLGLIHAHIERHPASTEELAYLTNTIMAGCCIQGRPFTAQEAADAVASTCNLGLENWPAGWRTRDLVTAFQVGWTILHRDVCMYTAKRLIDIVAGIECPDRDIHMRLNGLRKELTRHLRDRTPWHAREALDAIMMLDAPSWAALAALIDECPVIHAAVGASRRALRVINPGDFEFIAQNSQIAAVQEFLDALPSALTL